MGRRGGGTELEFCTKFDELALLLGASCLKRDKFALLTGVRAIGFLHSGTYESDLYEIFRTLGVKCVDVLAPFIRRALHHVREPIAV